MQPLVLLLGSVFVMQYVSVASVQIHGRSTGAAWAAKTASMKDCKVHWFEQQTDHFSWIPPPGNRSGPTIRQTILSSSSRRCSIPAFAKH
eukprot:529297-Rhodomonas_salina.2